ncbi:spore coat protein CotJB [Heliorestis acidaminivorans]|uniref:Spore coat protein CotJB n=1 Tax=Heliorestis acidaminivorans TaxID=553427 RepID=A0A6I0F481_9FIRM|nr:spore coat protein CotJB [Heliorestis acidaminivorans]KAB2951980.1 spore coat protein CotJB [Heliorestis acidaminivorans]
MSQHHHRDLLKRIMELDFVLLELNLFLDTHPDDQAALRDFAKVQEEVKRLKLAYEQKYGLLTIYGYCPERYPWNWIETPWPWEIKY